MFKFKRLVSIFVFSVLAFGNSAFGLGQQYAKVLILGEIGSGKTTLRNIIKQNFKQPVHTRDLSYESVKVYYDNKGNFTFDQNEANNNDDYKHTVVLNICDTSAEERHLKVVNEFALKGTHIALILADARNFFDPMTNKFKEYDPFDREIKKLKDISNCRIILILTHINDIPEKYREHIKNMSENLLNGFKDHVYNDQKIDEVKTLTIREQDDKNLKIGYINQVLGCIARSAWKYGIDNLASDSNDADWKIKEEEVYETKSHCIGKDTKVYKGTDYKLTKK